MLNAAPTESYGELKEEQKKIIGQRNSDFCNRDTTLYKKELFNYCFPRHSGRYGMC